MDRSPPETQRLRRNVEWALSRALDPAAVLPMLHRLSRLAPDGTDESVYAQRRLAELLAEPHPWRAALHAKRVLTVHPNDDGAWSILGLCHALLGHYRCAAAAYRRALDLAPGNATYAHNLGHLVDVALGRPRDALPWLRAAYEGSEGRADVAVSFAHALGRVGELAEAKRVTVRALRTASDQDGAQLKEHLALIRWLKQGAPEHDTILPRRPPARVVPSSWGRKTRAQRGSRPGPVVQASVTPSRRVHQRRASALDAALVRGLESLPLDSAQRSYARDLARDPWVANSLRADDATLGAMAAALAYAAVYVDHVPLTQADVAACYRVSVQALRGRFKALRSHLDLTPGDEHVAT